MHTVLGILLLIDKAAIKTENKYKFLVRSELAKVIDRKVVCYAETEQFLGVCLILKLHDHIRKLLTTNYLQSSWMVNCVRSIRRKIDVEPRDTSTAFCFVWV